MIPSPSYSRTSLFFELIECLLAGFYASMLLLFALDALSLPINESVELYVILPFLALAMLGSVFFAWRWHQRERAGQEPNGRIHAWLQGLIR